MQGGRTQAGLAAALAILIAACMPLGLNTASANIEREPAAAPSVLGAFGDDPPITGWEDWPIRRAPMLRQAFADHVYGPVPVELWAAETGRRVVDAAYAGGAGVLEEIDVRVGEGPDAIVFQIALAVPAGASPENPAPLLVHENFCGNAGTMGSEALSGGGCTNTGMFARMARLIFGVHIIEGPNAQILSRGYAYATIYPGAFASDSAKDAAADLERIAKLLPERRAPAGVLAVWAAAYGWSLDVLEKDPRIDPGRTAIWGHSRQGKAALLAAAHDMRIKAVMSIQSGTGGATLTRSNAGESVKQITGSYPHWFSPAYAAFAGREAEIPVDQHQLIALIAPRPVLLGNGWKDVWSDPNGSFRAAQGAQPVYELMGAMGLTQAGMSDPTQRSELDFFIRPGGHGVRKADWDEMLAFLDHWFMQTQSRPGSDPLADADGDAAAGAD